MKNEDNLHLFGRGESAVVSAEVSHVAIIRQRLQLLELWFKNYG